MKNIIRLMAVVLVMALTVAVFGACQPADDPAVPGDSTGDKAAQSTDKTVQTEPKGDSDNGTEPAPQTEPLDYGETGLRPLPKGQHVNAYTDSNEKHHHNLAESGEVWGIVANLQGTFDALNVYCSSYGDSKGTLTVTVYDFDTDYETSVAKDPVATASNVDFDDNVWFAFTWENPLPAGEYVVTITGSHGDWTAEDDFGVAIWDLDSSPFVRTYKDGEEVDTGVWAQFFIGD